MSVLDWNFKGDENQKDFLISLSALIIVTVIHSIFEDLAIRDTQKLSPRSVLNLVLLSSHSSLSRLRSILYDFPLCIYGQHCRSGCKCEVVLQNAVNAAADSALRESERHISWRAKLKILKLMALSLLLRSAMLGLEFGVIVLTFSKTKNNYLENGKMAITLCANSAFGTNFPKKPVIDCSSLLPRLSNSSDYTQNTQFTYCTRNVLSTYVDRNYSSKQAKTVRFVFTLDLTSDEANLNDARDEKNKLVGAEIYALARSNYKSEELVEGPIPAVVFGEEYEMHRNDSMSAQGTARWRKAVEKDLKKKLGGAYESAYKSDADWEKVADEMPKTRMFFEIRLDKLPPRYTKDDNKYVSANLLNDIVCLKESKKKNSSGIWHSTGDRIEIFSGIGGRIVENTIQEKLVELELWVVFAGASLIFRFVFCYFYPNNIMELILEQYKNSFHSRYEEV